MGPLAKIRCRGCDRTAYEDGGPTKWMPHWTQRISAAIITGDARRCLERLNGLKGEAARAAARHRPGRAHATTTAADDDDK